MIPPSVFLPQMREFLTTIRKRIVVVGSVARTIRREDFRLPKDIDVLCDLDSDRGREDIKAAIKRFDLHFESPSSRVGRSGTTVGWSRFSASTMDPPTRASDDERS